MNPRLVPLLCMSLLVLLSAPLQAAYVWTPSPPAQEIEARLAKLQTDAPAMKSAIAAGKRAAFFCANCHGDAGVSVLDHVPNLAGQNAFYLLAQIDKFGDGRRQDAFMSGLVKVLKPEERFNISVFYASLPVPPIPAKQKAQAASGGKHYARACAGCHGPKGHGTRDIARLAGQHNGYLVSALKSYRDGSRSRADPRMAGSALTLSDADIAALSSYLGSLP